MGLIALVLLLAVVGFLVYLVTTYVPMPPVFKQAIIVIVVIAVVLFTLHLLGFGDIPLGRIR